MVRLIWWMRIVGIVYLFLFVAASFLHLPIQAEGPEGVLERAAAGDATSRFVVDTWFVLGLELGVIGATLLIASRFPATARPFAWMIIGSEFFWGIGADVYKLSRGYQLPEPVIWIAIHSVIITTGLFALRRAKQELSGEV